MQTWSEKAAYGLLAENSGSDVPWDRGQSRDKTPVSLAHSFKNLQAFNIALSVLSLPTIEQSIFCSCSFSLCCPWGCSTASSSHPTPDNHYISVREESINAAEINKPACFLFQSEDKGGVCSAEQNSQALQGWQEKMWVFLVWTKYLETGRAQEYVKKKSLKFEMQKKKF